MDTTNQSNNDTIDAEKRTQKAIFDLWIWRNGNQSYFTTRLYDLMTKADRGNLMRLVGAFPIEGAVFCAWEASPSSEQFFLDVCFAPPVHQT